MSKNPQVIEVGRERVELTNGTRAYHLLFDVDRDVVHSAEELRLTQPVSMMSPAERRKATKCSVCSRARIILEGDVCLSCERTG